MSSWDDGQHDHPPPSRGADGRSSLEAMLFEALILQLIEKGVLTKNDALSVVQTVAEVRAGLLEDGAGRSAVSAELALLRRLYDSFEALPERKSAEPSEASNVRQLRPPLHRDAPEFPIES